MKIRNLLFLILMVFCGSVTALAQSEPNLEVGFRPYGSYHGSEVDTVGLMNGNLTLHIPLPGHYPQRGGQLDSQALLVMNSKTWRLQYPEGACQGNDCLPFWNLNPGWTPAALASGDTLQPKIGRTYQVDSDAQGNLIFSAWGYFLTGWDGMRHELMDVSNGNLAEFEAADASGWRINMNATGGVPTTGTLLDGHGNQYQIQFGTPALAGPYARSPVCSTTTAPTPISNGDNAPLLTLTPDFTSQCNQAATLVSVTDANGNLYQFNGTTDTLGRQYSSAGSFAGTTDLSGCVSALPVSSPATITTYSGPNGVVNQVKTCFSLVNVQTNFGVSGTREWPIQSGGSQTLVPVTILLPDGTRWTLSYDSYGNVTSMGLPLGGTVSYQWGTVAFPNISNTPVSRVAIKRTITDNLGHSSIWRYQWMTQQSNPAQLNGSYSNIVTDPNGNDTVHVFTNTLGGFYETSSLSYQGSSNGGQLLKRVDTTYSVTLVGSNSLQPGTTVLPTSIRTTLGGKVSLVQKTYDTALSDPASGATSFGKVLTEKVYDWGQGAPGALLRETDTSYVWQTDARYRTAHLLDLPASVVIKDGNGNRVAETDYVYDESQYLTASNITTQHGAPPNTVRGNLTSIKHWLNTSNSFISSHTNWYDTGEVYQQIDPLGNTTTHSYDPVYAGAYSTKTQDALGHSVSGTYDFNTGLLTSFTNANATTQASGNTHGDTAHTSNYAYDFMGRMISATLPADPSGNHPQTTFNYPDATTMERLHTITATLTDDAFTYTDGLGRSIRSRHVVSGGNALVDMTYDGLDRAATVTNPYFSTSELTYGVTQNQYDALGRLTQATKQDGSISTVSYSDNCTTTTDEAGRQRRACSDAAGRLVEVDEPNPGAVDTSATGSVSISGSEQSNPQAGAPASGTVTLSGSEQSTTIDPCSDQGMPNPCPRTIWDAGSVSITVNGHSDSTSYGLADTPATIAANLGAAIRGDSAALVTATVSGSTLTLTSRGVGASMNYSFTASASSSDSADFPTPSFSTSQSGSTLTGGRDGTTNPDSGSVTITVNGTSYTTPYGGTDTPGTIAARLAGLVSGGAWTNAQAVGGAINLTSKITGTGGDYLLAASSTYDSAHFAGPSFTTTASGTSLSGGYSARDLDNHPYVTLYRYDALGKLLCVEQHGDSPSGPHADGTAGTGCSADPGNDANSTWRVRRFTYDSLSRLLTAHNPESGLITYQYDSVGNLINKTSPAANQLAGSTQTTTISYCYDSLNRLTGKAYSAQSCPLSSPVVTYVYDQGTNGIGHLTSLTDQAGSAIYSYDVLGRLSSENRTMTVGTKTITKTMSYSYNLDGSVATVTYPSGAVITYAPDSAGRTVSAIDKDNSINYVTGTTYNAASALTGSTYGQNGSFSGIVNSFSFNNRLQPATLWSSSPTRTLMYLVYDFHLGNGDNGNVYAITNNRDINRNQTFTYDPLNRLLSAQNAGTDCNTKLPDGHTEYWGNSYVYDAWGNLSQKQVTKCSAENLSMGIAVNNRAQGGSYVHDVAGNMLRDNHGTNYLYDPENRINSTAGFTYTYDADGNRVEKANGTSGMGTLYWYMTPGIVGESDLSGNLQSEYVFFDGERVARKDFPGNVVSYYFSDHLKTASVITDAVGAIKAESDYYPWGGELQFTNNDSNHYKFTGKERDAETGLDYFGARYYSNGLGRFITPDWAAKPAAVPYAVLGDPQSLNLYTYVRNIPTSNADADGHCAIPGLCLAIDVMSGIFRDGGVKPYAKNVAIGSAKGAGSFVVNTVKMLDAGMSGNPAKMIDAVMSPGPAALQPSNATQAQASIVTQGALALGTMAIPASSAGAVVDMTAAIKAPSVIGFSSTETGMINSSLKTLSGAGYDLAPFQQLIKADMPPGCCAMSLSTPPTGAALGDSAFSSQGMLDHTLEEELLHLGQGLPNQTFGPGSAAANEAAVDAVRKIPAPPQ